MVSPHLAASSRNALHGPEPKIMQIINQPPYHLYLCLILLFIAACSSDKASPVASHLSVELAGNGLPLGDGKISQVPKVGYVFSCQTRFHDGPGAFKDGEWIRDGRWYRLEKVQVDGDVPWPNARISIQLNANQRLIIANNLPTHGTGIYPIDSGDDAFDYDRNPNPILEQTILLRLPANPSIADSPECLNMGMIGFALTGVAIFNALDAGGRDAPAHEIQDHCNGHPERQGQYHYHDMSQCMKDVSGNNGQHSDLLGYALDGFGIYGPHGAGA